MHITVLSLLLAGSGLLGTATAQTPTSSATASAVSSGPLESCSPIVVDSITVEDTTLVCCKELELAIAGLGTGVGINCTNADYTVDFTQGTCTTVAGFPVGACCEVVGAVLESDSLVCAVPEAAS